VAVIDGFENDAGGAGSAPSGPAIGQSQARGKRAEAHSPRASLLLEPLIQATRKSSFDTNAHLIVVLFALTMQLAKTLKKGAESEYSEAAKFIVAETSKLFQSKVPRFSPPIEFSP
jgi:hypothetical protein